MTTEAGPKPLNMRWAITNALDEELERDPAVCLLGEDIGASGGTFGLTRGLFEKYGALRVRDTPIAEEGLANLTVGMAIGGLRPVLEIMFMDFTALIVDALVNQAAKTRYLAGGDLTCPLVVRTLAGGGFKAGAHHSQSLEALFAGTPGLKVVTASTPADAKGLLKAAIRDDNPVLSLEYKALFGVKGPVPDGDHVVEIGKADVKRPGSHVSLVAWGRMVHLALAAAEQLAAEGIEAEVLDLRTLLPLDREAILDTAAKTGNVVIVQESPKPVGVGSEVAAILAEEGLFHLDAPVRRVTGAFTPIPIGDAEELLFPTADGLCAEVRALLAG